MLGAYVLAGELHRTDGDYMQAFAVYESQLQDFMRNKQKAAAGFAESFAPKTEMGLSVRNAVLKLMSIPVFGVGLTRYMFKSTFALPTYTNMEFS
jgi:2-polyprenyl-6-methoxyphenol hydroxylase-like FAD-dependent oxidoreductase